MNVAVIGGKLQGLEAAYLAKKAGWQVLVVDRKPDVPAAVICDQFCCLDINRREEFLARLKGIDLIIPALENRPVLEKITAAGEESGIPVAFDPAAYDISASKSVSDRLFSKIGIPAPRAWPDCSFPVIAKPSCSSGSEGVLLIRGPREMELFKENVGAEFRDWVVQEYLNGPSYSIEVVGHRGAYRAMPVTELEMDDLYDCKRVLAPPALSDHHRDQFAQIAVEIAQKLRLKGIMDVEVILHRGELKVLEIDARLPSQTPIAVYQSTGINMLKSLAAVFLEGRIPAEESLPRLQKASIFEHIVVSPGKLVVSGEHAVSAAGPLSYCEDFFGADEALTNYRPGNENWTATLIITGSCRAEAFDKRDRVIEKIRGELGISYYNDPVPVVKEFIS